MSLSSYDSTGTLRQFWDDEGDGTPQRPARTYHEYDEQGEEILARPYNAEENAVADVSAVQAAQQASLDSSRAAVKLIITDLQTEKARVQPVIDLQNSATVTTSQIKDVAKATKRVADAAIELARFVQDMS